MKKAKRTKSFKNKKMKKARKLGWSSLIKEAEKQLSEQKFHYKDKPVHGEPTDKQYNAIKSFCIQRNLQFSIIGMDREEATKILAYFFNKSGKEVKPKCFDKYISKEKY